MLIFLLKLSELFRSKEHFYILYFLQSDLGFVSRKFFNNFWLISSRIRIQDAKILQRIWILSTASMYPSFHSSFLHIFSQSYFYLIIHWLISCIIYSPFHLIHFCSYYYILSYFLRDIFILYILTLTWTLS